MRCAYLTTMKINHFAGMVALTVFLAGCSASASGTKFKDSSFVTQRVADDKGRVIFYREADTNSRWVTLGIDRSIVGALAQSGFIVADIAPGDHSLSAWLRYMPGECNQTNSFSRRNLLHPGVSPGRAHALLSLRWHRW